VTVKKNGNNHGTFTTKVVRSVFVLLATRGHDILYSDWERRYSVDLYIALTLTFVYRAQQYMCYYRTVNNYR